MKRADNMEEEQIGGFRNEDDVAIIKDETQM